MEANYSIEMHRVFTSYEIMFWLYDFVLPFILLPGMFVTLASVVIFGQKIHQTTTQFASRAGGSGSESLHTLLLGLSFYDFLVLCNAALVYIPMALCYHARNDIGCWIFNGTMMFTYPLSLIAQFGSVWTCAAITIDRYIVVRFPLQSRKWCTTKKTFCILLLITICAIAYRIPPMFEWTHDVNGYIVPTKLRTNAVYFKIYHFYCSLFVMFVVPWAIMITLNIIIYRAIRQAVVKRLTIAANRKQDTSGKEHRKPFLMALLVVLTFLLFNLLTLINHLLEMIAGEPNASGRLYIARQCLIYSSNFLICCNSACNFFIYCALGRWFRQSFVNTFCLPCVLLRNSFRPDQPHVNTDNLYSTFAASNRKNRLCSPPTASTRLSSTMRTKCFEESEMTCLKQKHKTSASPNVLRANDVEEKLLKPGIKTCDL